MDKLTSFSCILLLLIAIVIFFFLCGQYYCMEEAKSEMEPAVVKNDEENSKIKE